MANNNDGIPRPSTFPIPPIPGTAQTLSANILNETVTRLVTEALNREGRQIINSFLHPELDNSNNVDQVIDPPHANNLDGLDKIPDVVKSLREFSGQQGEFGSWRKSVERILKIYNPLIGTSKFYGILTVIRNKIVGHADVVLESYNTPLNWEKISQCLQLHYADKRDLGTLEYQMTTLIQGNSSIQDFYQTVYHHLSLILNKLSSMDMSNESMNNLTRTYRDKALDTFIRGLRGDLPRLLSMREPTDLPQALHLCMKLQNVDYRTQYANNNYRNRQNTPPIPPRRTPSQAMPTPAPRKHFYPELYHQPGTQQQFQRNFQHPPRYQNQFNNNRQFPKPIPRPEPMDVDNSIQTRQVNYQNRPSQPLPQKRCPSQSLRQHSSPNKYQRLFNTEEMNEYTEQIDLADLDNDESFLDYMSDEKDILHDPSENLSEVHFLDM